MIINKLIIFYIFFLYKEVEAVQGRAERLLDKLLVTNNYNNNVRPSLGVQYIIASMDRID